MEGQGLRGGLASGTRTHTLRSGSAAGTTIEVDDVLRRFRAFLDNFTPSDADAPIYPTLLRVRAHADAHARTHVPNTVHVRTLQEKIGNNQYDFNLDMQNLLAFDAPLYTVRNVFISLSSYARCDSQMTVRYPAEMVPLLDLVVRVPFIAATHSLTHARTHARNTQVHDMYKELFPDVDADRTQRIQVPFDTAFVECSEAVINAVIVVVVVRVIRSAQ